MTILDEMLVRGVHYVLHTRDDGRVPYDSYGLDRFVRFTLYAIEDGHGEQIGSWAVPDWAQWEYEKILGVAQRNTGKWKPVVGRREAEFFGERPILPPCGKPPVVCCKQAKTYRTVINGTPMAGTITLANCQCGSTGPATGFPSSEWTEEIGAG